MYKATSVNEVIKTNTILQPKGYAHIFITNTGETNVYINDNILLTPGDSWTFQTYAYCVIAESTNIRFAADSASNKVLVEYQFFKKVN